MAYIGPPASQKLATPTSQYFSGNGSTTAFTLNRPVNVAEDLNVFVNNVPQEPGPGKSYTATGTTLTFDAAPSSGTNNVYVVYRGLAEPTTRLEHPSGQPLAATTGAFSGNVTIGGNLSVTGTGAGAAGITSASTSGTAINIDSSNRVTMPNVPAFLARRNDTTTTVPSGGVMPFDSVSVYGAFDTDSGFNTSTYTYTFKVAGLYRIHVSAILGGQSYSNAQLKIQVNNADYEQRHFSSTNSDYYTHSVDTLVNASVNDTTRIKCTVNATFYGNQWSVFMGHLIG